MIEYFKVSVFNEFEHNILLLLFYMDPIYTQLYHKYSMKYRRMIDKYILVFNIDISCINGNDGLLVVYC